MRSYLEIIQECDNFPHPSLGKNDAFTKAIAPLWSFFLPDDPEPHGFLIQSVVDRMPWTAHFFRLDPAKKEVHLLKPKPFGRDDDADWQAACSTAIDDLLDLARAQGVFPRLGKKTAEQFPILGARFDIGIDRSAMSLFGIVGRGAHMTVYTRDPPVDQGGEGGGGGAMKFWIPRRSSKKSTYPGMLDQAVAGGVARGETPLECIIREAGEETTLEAGMVRGGVVAAGTVTWWNVADERAGGELGLMNPGVLYVYDLEVGGEVVLESVDEDDIQAFRLMGVEEVRAALRDGDFKPSCALVMVDFFVRHGLITAEDEEDYAEIVQRLHRRLPFKTRP